MARCFQSESKVYKINLPTMPEVNEHKFCALMCVIRISTISNYGQQLSSRKNLVRWIKSLQCKHNWLSKWIWGVFSLKSRLDSISTSTSPTLFFILFWQTFSINHTVKCCQLTWMVPNDIPTNTLPLSLSKFKHTP